MNSRYSRYRDWPKRIYLKDTPYFLTFYTQNRFPFFRNPILCELFLANLKICKKIKCFRLYGWVILYEHIHLLLEPRGKWNVSEIMHAIKRHSSRDINCLLKHFEGEPVSAHSYAHLLEAVKRSKQLKQENKISLLPSFRWQKSFYDRFIRSESHFKQTLSYITHNPQKHRMPVGWRWVFKNRGFKELIDDP